MSTIQERNILGDMVSDSSILITGGAGFVGSQLAMGLRRLYPGTRIVALDNLKRRGSELNLPRLKAADIEFIHGDIRNPGDLDSVGAVDLLLECSAEPSVLAGVNSAPDYLLDTNLGGSIHCFEYARKCGAGVIFLSSSRVYPIGVLEKLAMSKTDTRFELDSTQPVDGVTQDGITENFPLNGPRSLYGATKLCSEILLQEYVSMYGIRGVINRCGVLTGPWQMGKVDQGVVVLWAARHVYGGALSYIGYGGTGKQVRDILHVNDLLDLVVYQIENLDSLNGELFNAGGGREVSVSLQELTAICATASGNTIEIGRVPETRELDVPVYLTDNSYVNQKTGWSPKTSPTAIIDEIVEWLREHETTLRPILGG